MFKPIQFLMVAPAAAWPGKAAIRKDGNTIFKTMLGPSHPQISIKSAFKLEVEALTRLESSRKELMCDNGRRHFPAVEDNEQKFWIKNQFNFGQNDQNDTTKRFVIRERGEAVGGGNLCAGAVRRPGTGCQSAQSSQCHN